MKRTWTCSALVLAGWMAIIAGAQAGLIIPKSVYTVGQMEEAVADSRESGKVISFLYTDRFSTCGLCNNAGEMVLATFRRSTVLIYAASGTDGDFGKLPEKVRAAIRSKEAGRYIPITVFYDPAGDAIVHILPYANGPELHTNLRDAKRALSEVKKASSSSPRAALPAPPPPPVAGLKPDPSREMRTWTASGGATVEASILEEQGAYCILRTADGASMKILASRLSPADRTYIDSLKKPD